MRKVSKEPNVLKKMLTHTRPDPNKLSSVRETLEHIDSILPTRGDDYLTPLSGIAFPSEEIVIGPASRTETQLPVRRRLIHSEFSYRMRMSKSNHGYDDYPTGFAATAINSYFSPDVDRIEHFFLDTELGCFVICDREVFRNDEWALNNEIHRSRVRNLLTEHLPLWERVIIDNVYRVPYKILNPDKSSSRYARAFDNLCGVGMLAASEHSTACLALYYIKDRVCSFVLLLRPYKEEVDSLRALIDYRERI